MPAKKTFEVKPRVYNHFNKMSPQNFAYQRSSMGNNNNGDQDTREP